MEEGFVEVSQLRDKNQLTIPKKVREHLTLDVGDFIRFERNNGQVFMTKVLPLSTSENHQPSDGKCGDGRKEVNPCGKRSEAA